MPLALLQYVVNEASDKSDEHQAELNNNRVALCTELTYDQLVHGSHHHEKCDAVGYTKDAISANQQHVHGLVIDILDVEIVNDARGHRCNESNHKCYCSDIKNLDSSGPGWSINLVVEHLNRDC